MRKLSLLALVLGLAACRGDDGGDDMPGMDANPGKTDYTIQEIQNDSMPACTPADPTTCVSLTIKGVVVTAIDVYGGKTGDFWVEEPEGGEYSGVHVYGAPLDSVAALRVGDVVDLAGAVKDEFHYNGSGGSGGFPEGYSITELKPVAGGTLTVTATGETMEITPDVVDALAIGQMGDYTVRDPEWEKWEGVLIKVTNVAAQSKDDYVSSKCPGTDCSDETLRSFEITGGVVVESALGALPTPLVARGDCLGSVTGVLDYFFSYQILPRDLDADMIAEEVVTTGGTCPTENDATTCADDIDNDGNGFKDCGDNACIAAAPSCTSSTTINAIQTAATPPTGAVKVESVCVVALSRAVGNPAKSFNMWVQTGTGTATLNDGIFVYGPGADLSAFTPGTKVDVIGTVKEFNDAGNMGTGTLTQIAAISVTAAAGTCNPQPLPAQDAAPLSMDANGEPAESIYVELKNVEIKTVGSSNYHVGTMEQGTTTFSYDDDSFRIPEGTGGDGVGTCYSSISGIWSYQVYDNAWYFLPTAAGTKGASTLCQ